MDSERENVQYERHLRKAVSSLQSHLGDPPVCCWVLGSGLGDFSQELAASVRLPYSAINGFSQPTVPGHAGELALFELPGGPICCLRGRTHFYEGLPLKNVVLPVRALALWGVSTFVLTNAAGAINVDFAPGDLMVIRDHINFMGDNPLCGPHLAALGERFPDMTSVYSRHLADLASSCADRLGIKLRHGIYVSVKGPSYETPAEIRMFRLLGADAVGMSTVPEAIALHQAQKRILGLSCITNMAAGTLSCRLEHSEVLRVGRSVQGRLRELLEAIHGALVESPVQTTDGVNNGTA